VRTTQQPFRWTKAIVRREGSDMTARPLTATTMQLMLQAADKMKSEHGINVECIDLRTLNPLDKPTPILNSVAKTKPRGSKCRKIIALLGISSEISAVIAEQAFECLDAPILRVHRPPTSRPFPFAPPLEKFYNCPRLRRS